MKYFAVIVCGVMAACGGGPNKEYGDPINNPAADQSAEEALEAVLDLGALTENPEDTAALDGVGGLFSSASALLAVKAGQQAQQALKARPDMRLTDPTCVTASANMVTYDNCQLGEGDGAGVIDGSIGWVLQNGVLSIDADLTMDFSSSDGDFVITMNVDMDVSNTAVVGTWSINADLSTQGVEFEYALSGDYDVTLDAGGCPTGGTAEFHGEWSANVNGQSNSEDVWVLVTFAEPCGSVTIQ